MAIQIPPLRGFISCFIGVSEAEVAAQHEAVSIFLIIISGHDSSTQLQSWHSSVSRWFGVAVAVFLRAQYTHTGLYWDPPDACNQSKHNLRLMNFSWCHLHNGTYFAWKDDVYIWECYWDVKTELFVKQMGISELWIYLAHSSSINAPTCKLHPQFHVS